MADPLLYDSLHDPNLQSYFGHKNVQKHLRKVGFLNRRGEILPDKDYQSAIRERSRQEQVRALLSHGIVQRVVELEKTREANLRNQFELTKRKLTVENIKESKLKSKQFNSKDLILFNQIKAPPQIPIDDQPKLHSRRLKKRRSSSRKTGEKKIDRQSNDDPNRKDLIEMTMIYLGSSNKVYPNDHHADILIMQQHCGGQNICVFKQTLKINENFQFKSHRQKDYPFALTLYVDGFIDSRISVCCEYKHKLNTPLGGMHASFAILNVQGGNPCQTCRFNEYLATHPLLNPSSNDQITLLSETLPSEITEQSNPERNLPVSPTDGTRKPSFSDLTENTLTVSNENNDLEEAKQIYLEIKSKINENVFSKQNGLYHYQLGNICKEGLLDNDLAYEHYLNSLEIFLLYYSANNMKLRNIYLNLSHLLILKNENHLAIKYFQRILDIDYSFKYINYLNLINTHNYLSLLYLNEKKYEKSLYHLNKCLIFYPNCNSNQKTFNKSFLINQSEYDEKALKSLSIDQLPSLPEIHHHLSILYEKISDQSNAFQHIRKAIQLEKGDQNKLSVYQNHLTHLQKKFCK